MKMTAFFLEQLEREAVPTRKALERVPEGRNDWKPHPRSMELGYLAALVARMPSWIGMIIKMDEFDMWPQGGSVYTPQSQMTNRELIQLLDESLTEARQTLAGTTDEHLMKPWRLLAGGKLMMEQPRYVFISDSVFTHLAHHRGQLTVYLRLNDAMVPAIYGPSADEGRAA